MSLRYRPSPKLVVISLLIAGLLSLNYLALEPAQQQAAQRLADLQSTHASIQKQLQQTPSESDQRLLSQLQWTGPDWAKSVLDSMNAAQGRAQGLKATYTLGTPTTVSLNDEDYSALQIDLEVHTEQDQTLFRFIDTLLDTLPGVSAITSMQIAADDRSGALTATLSLSLYRVEQP